MWWFVSLTLRHREGATKVSPSTVRRFWLLVRVCPLVDADGRAKVISAGSQGSVGLEYQIGLYVILLGISSRYSQESG